MYNLGSGHAQEKDKRRSERNDSFDPISRTDAPRGTLTIMFELPFLAGLWAL